MCYLLEKFQHFCLHYLQVSMLKWTKRTEPGGSGVSGTKLSTFLLAPQQNNRQRAHARRSLGNLSRPISVTNREKQRKSLGSSELSKRIQNRDKENQLILTPHPNGFRQNITSTPVIAFGSKLDYALRDVRNITPKPNSNSISTLINVITPSRKRPLAKTPPESPKIDRVICSSPKESALALNASVIAQQTPYASTLPTFDVEYSPCGPSQTVLRPNPINSITVTTDSLFNQQRYFQEPLPSKRPRFSPNGLTPLSSRSTDVGFSKLKYNSRKCKVKVGKKRKDCGVNCESEGERGNNFNNNNDNNKNHNEYANNNTTLMKAPPNPCDTKDSKLQIPSTETSLSSSALDDTALDKMIDAILESARKERPSIVRNLAPRKIHMALMQMDSDSPTYTAAEDPANDLNKFCDNFQISPDKLIGERTIILEERDAVNEREVRTPEPLEIKRVKLDAIKSSRQKLLNSCHLKRQRAVRRKHVKCDQNVQFDEQQKIKTEPSNTETSLSNEALRSECSDILSPKTPNDSDFTMSSFFKKNADNLANMVTPVIESNDSDSTYAQQPQFGITSISSKLSSDSTPYIHTNDLQASSTPTHIETVNAIRRCLTFCDSPSQSNSLTNDDDTLEKRKSTASSTNSMASMSNISNSVRSTSIISGTLDLSISVENNKIHIHGELV